MDLKKENQRLYKRIDDLRQEQISLQTQVGIQAVYMSQKLRC